MKRFRINLISGLLCLTATFFFGCDSVPDTIVSFETQEPAHAPRSTLFSSANETPRKAVRRRWWTITAPRGR